MITTRISIEKYQKPVATATMAVTANSKIMPIVIEVSGFIMFASWCARTNIVKYMMLYSKIRITKKIMCEAPFICNNMVSKDSLS